MARIAMIGAGSIVFCKTLSMDIMATPGLRDSTLVLMNHTEPKLRKMEAFLKDVVKENNLPTKIEATTDYRTAIKGADYVINMIQVGGLDAFEQDYKIPMKYGVDQCIGDTMGPGGIFRALRTIPVLIDQAQQMRELCPDAIMLNYVNPMAACCWALGTVPGLQYIGLCHGVQTTMDLISGYVGLKKEEIDYVCAGINHMAWFLKLENDGKDLYPILKEKFEQPEYYVNEKVRGEVMRHFGYFMTESTGHLSEYIPWFRSSERGLKTYCDMPDFGGATGAYYIYSKNLAEKFQTRDPLSIESKKLAPRSGEYCSWIIEAKETRGTFRLNGNVRNDGLITNLPNGCCVEVPIFVDAMGVHSTVVGNLPPQCAAVNMTNVNAQGLTVEAAINGDPDLAAAAIALDPLTSTRLTLKEARDMTTEMLQAEAQWLPQFKGKMPKPTPAISIPKDVKAADVPVDPALAISARFGKLAQE